MLEGLFMLAKLFLGAFTCCVVFGCLIRPFALILSICAFPAYLGIFYAQDIPPFGDWKWFHVRAPKRRSVKMMMDIFGTVVTFGTGMTAIFLARPF